MSFEMEKAIPDTPASAFYVAQILNEARAYKESRGDLSWGLEEFTIDEVQPCVQSGKTYLARQNGEFVGTAVFTWSDVRIWGREHGRDESAGYLHRLAIKDGFRGQGIGEQIIGWAEDQVREADRDYLRLDCSSGNKRLRAFYESLGFTAFNEGRLATAQSVLYQKRVG